MDTDRQTSSTNLSMERPNKEASAEKGNPIRVDLTKVKEEPTEYEYAPSTCSTDTISEHHISHQERSMESPLPIRFNRARYVRRSYASPESSVCEVCQAEFAGPDVLRLHKIAHFNTATVCYVCDNIFIDSNNSIGTKLSLHMASQHKAICTPTGTYKPEAERSFVCSICLQRFSSNKILTLHTLKQHKISELKNITCKICSIDHSSTRSLHIHLMSSQHKDMKIKIQGLFMCVDCRAVFPARDSYAMHMMMRAQSESCTSLENIVAQESHRSVSLENTKNIPNEYTFSLSRPVTNQNISKPESSFIKNPIAARYEDSKYASGYKCSLCGLHFYHPDTLSIHMKMSHDGLMDMSMLHQRSGRQFDLEKTLGLFRGLEKSGVNWTCVACGYDFHSCDSLAMHVMEQHSVSAITEVESRVRENHRTSPLGLSKIHRSKSPECKPPSLVIAKPTPNASGHVENGKVNGSTTMSERCEENEQIVRHKNDIEHTEEPKAKIQKTDSDSEEKNVTTNYSYSCVLCKELFENKKQLLLHGKMCPGEKDPVTLKCLGCQQLFSNVLTYSKHTCNEHQEQRNTVVCMACDQKLSGSKLIEHFESGNSCSQITHSERIRKKRKGDAGENEVLGDLCKQKVNDSYCEKSHDSNSSILDAINTEGKTLDIANDQLKCTSATMGQSKATNSLLNVESECHSTAQIDIETEERLSDALEKDTIIQALVQDAVANKRNRRKTKPSTKGVEQNSREEMQDQPEMTSVNDQSGLIAIPVSPASSPHLTEALPVLENGSSNGQTLIDATGHEHLEGQALFNFVLANSPNFIMCKYCHIIYTNRTMYYLHMGLHNLNNPWQCNLCGKVCSNVHEFSSHVIHYR